MMIRRNAFLAAAIAAAMPLSAAFAQDGGGDRQARREADRQALAAAKIDAAGAASAARTAGYGPVREVEWERGVWEVKTYDNQGRRVSLNIDPTSGAVTPRTH
ncbi:PepSY domain-containing protein [Acetobacteraceae bacterium H6797]|nr:PepSY domain-containing protein [Acetobacteraceae bacterium H6797]